MMNINSFASAFPNLAPIQETPKKLSRRDMDRDPDSLRVKALLGKRFFTGKLNIFTRYRRIADLTTAERRIARANRWI
mgnify:CR=1 FL=1